MRVLPEIDRILVATGIRQPLIVSLAVQPSRSFSELIPVKDEAGAPMIGVVKNGAPGRRGRCCQGDIHGHARRGGEDFGRTSRRQQSFGDMASIAELRLTVKGLKTDQAFAERLRST
jgi:hypothetical protein